MIKKKYSDIDIWVKSKESFNLAIKYFESKDAILKDSSDTFKVFYFNGIYYDVHHWKYFDSPIDAMQYVDMTINCCFFDGESFFFPDDFIYHIENKMIVWNCFNGYSIDLINERLKKMVRKGFNISKDEIKRINIEIFRKNNKNEHT